MKSTPIIYSAPMVLARLAGRKTNTRRLINPQPVIMHEGWPYLHNIPASRPNQDKQYDPIKCPYGQPGDELWTRETFTITRADYDLRFGGGRDRLFLVGRYLADDTAFDITLTREETAKFEKWKRQEGTFPAIFMFRSLCRDTATITAIHPQPLQDITEADAWAEGVSAKDYNCGRVGYKTLWNSINAKQAPWESNPWVWSIHTTPHA